MAAPTNVRVESNSTDTATLRWTYAGTAAISVHRSLTSGSGFSEITDVTNRVLPGTTTYIDDTPEAGTRYFYKLSDDAGSTFSSEVSVVIQSCLAPAGSNDTFSLPRSEDDVRSDDFNNLAERIEAVLSGRVLAPDVCIVCPVNGAIVLNCAGHCREWLVIADEDINSISLQYCDEGEGNIDFVIPPNTTRSITGWPNGFGFSGDEPSIITGANGRTMSVGTGKTGGTGKSSSSKPSTGRGIGSGGGTGGPGGCNCTAVDGNLTIKSCNANNSLDCHSTKKLNLIACGGVPPYTWSNTGNVTLSKSTGANTAVSPPTNSGSGEAGTAYAKNLWGIPEGHSVGTTHAVGADSALYGCDDAFDSCDNSGGTPINCAFVDATPDCVPHEGHPISGDGGTCGTVDCSDICTDNCTCAQTKGAVEDRRSAGMIAAGCVPCGLSEGNTVTVTDAVGTQVTIILKA